MVPQALGSSRTPGTLYGVQAGTVGEEGECVMPKRDGNKYKIIKPIETKYKGILFRSRLEARWAYFFDLIGVQWEYEPEGYVLPSGPYLPDFWLPKVSLRGARLGLFVEVKPTADNDDDRFREFVEVIEKNLAVVCGNGFLNTNGTYEGFQYAHDGAELWWDNYMGFYKCKKCGFVKFEFMESRYMNCPACNSKRSMDDSQLLEFAQAAQGYRFDERRGLKK